MIRMQQGIIAEQQFKIWNGNKANYTQDELNSAKLAWGYTVEEFDAEVKRFYRIPTYTHNI